MFVVIFLFVLGEFCDVYRFDSNALMCQVIDLKSMVIKQQVNCEQYEFGNGKTTRQLLRKKNSSHEFPLTPFQHDESRYYKPLQSFALPLMLALF